MASPSVTYTFTNGTTADATQVNQNFTDLVNSLTDGTKDLSISALTCAGSATLNGNVTLGNASGDDITVSGSIASHVVSKTTGTYNLGSTSIGYLGVYQSAGASYTFSWLGSTSAAASYTLMVPTATGVIGQGMVVSASGVLSWKPQQMDTSAKSAAYVITDTDGIRTVLVTTGASDRDVTLPTAADNTHRIITVKKVDSGTGKVTVKSDAAGETIDGVSGTTGIELTSQYEPLTVQCDGSVWHIVGFNEATATRPGLISADAQAIGGDKTFNGNIVAQSLSCPKTTFATAGTTNNYNVSDISVLRVDTASGAIVMNGLSGGRDGQILYIVKDGSVTAANSFTLKNVTSGVTQNVVTTTTADIVIAGGDFALITLVYGGAADRWTAKE